MPQQQPSFAEFINQGSAKHNEAMGKAADGIKSGLNKFSNMF
jgi:hypothetical protein